MGGKHIELNAGNVLLIFFMGALGAGVVGVSAEYLATRTNIPLVTAGGRGLRHFLGWSQHSV